MLLIVIPEILRELVKQQAALSSNKTLQQVLFRESCLCKNI